MSCTCQNHHLREFLAASSSLRPGLGPAPPSGDVSFVLFFHILYCALAYACTYVDVDSFIVPLSVCVSDLLAGEKKKACDEIFLKSSHYLDSKLSLSGSAAYYLIAQRNSLMLPVQIGLPDAVHTKEKHIGRGNGISGN